MSAKQDLHRSIYNVLQRYPEGSFNTRAARKYVLMQVIDQLAESRYKVSNIKGLKQKHMRFLNETWKQQGQSAATIKNRNAHLRWLCKKMQRLDAMPSNDELGVAKRRYVTNRDKSIDIQAIDLTKISNHYVLVQIHLQRYFGLRREECIKMKPHLADHGEYIKLQPSWCKGGRGRTVPVHTAEARYWLDQAKLLARTKASSLIPDNRLYRHAKQVYDQQLQRADIPGGHGFRHAYAMGRYREITGFEPPCKGGPSRKSLAGEMRALDDAARDIVSEELGHSRRNISSIYLGV